ncbi:uncharacterized protein PAC_09185 [Phialocephala subalpina]|uniref:BTB domain-containing protein n=1 Tax=Phialocephala subalpina TaxID=576137 RepID=A0A1L7X2P6_9HELO|nr:uncharacterized protein PAC_09185 [Phialocephala subalpina]
MLRRFAGNTAPPPVAQEDEVYEQHDELDFSESTHEVLDLACPVSIVWEKAFNGPFTEGRTLTYDMSDIEPKVFVLLEKWIYGRDLDLGVAKAMKTLSGEQGSIKEDERTSLQKWTI